jgi:hypothetical protein
MFKSSTEIFDLIVSTLMQNTFNTWYEIVKKHCKYECDRIPSSTLTP